MSPDALATELAAMLRHGVTTSACRLATGLTGLAVVRARAASDSETDRAVAARAFVRQAAIKLDGEDGPICITLGIAPGYAATPLGTRRAKVAELLSVSTEHLRKDREPRMLQAVADEIIEVDSVYRSRQAHRDGVGGRGPGSGIQIDWYAFHQAYHRVWQPIARIRNDLVRLIGYLTEAKRAGLVPRTAANVDALGKEHPSLPGLDDWHPIAERCMTICWGIAQLDRATARFTDEHGGIWILATQETEEAVARDIYRINIFQPLGTADHSVLAGHLNRAEDAEFDPFELGLLEDAAWPILRDALIDWAQELVDAGRSFRAVQVEASLAARDPQLSNTPWFDTEPTTDCERWLQAADNFIRVIDADWYEVADWYRPR